MLYIQCIETMVMRCDCVCNMVDNCVLYALFVAFLTGVSYGMDPFKDITGRACPA
jgi:hypothetical protein